MDAGDVRFNLQQFLTEMRAEQREDIKSLTDKVDGGFFQLHGRISAVQNKVNDHETRVTVVEKTSRLIGWCAGAMIVALLGAAATWAFGMVPGLFAAVKP